MTEKHTNRRQQGRAEIAVALTALNAYRLTRNWEWRDLAVAMGRAGFPVAATTLQRIVTKPSDYPNDRTRYKVQQFLKLTETTEVPDPPRGWKVAIVPDQPPSPAPPPAPLPPPMVATVVEPPPMRQRLGDLRLGDGPLPAILTRDEFAKILHISHATGWRLEKSNKLAHFELLPRVGRPRYSGKKVQAWLDGEGDMPRYFTSARRIVRGGRA